MRVAAVVRGVSRTSLAVAMVAMLAAFTGACSDSSSEEIPKIELSQHGPNPAAGADISPQTADGTILTDLTFDLFDGGTGTIGDFRGTPLVVNFFASWCPPCVREMPEFQAVFEDFDGRVAFLGLSQDSSGADALALVESTGVRYDVGWDPDLEVYGATDSIAMPTTAFVSASGELRDVFAGVLNQESLAERIENVLGVAART